MMFYRGGQSWPARVKQNWAEREETYLSTGMARNGGGAKHRSRLLTIRVESKAENVSSNRRL